MSLSSMQTYAPGTAITARSGQRYHILGLIGTGETGAIYEAELLPSRQRRAVKVIAASATRAGLLAALECLPALAHPHLPRYDLVLPQPDGSVWLVMEYIAGPTLQQLVWNAYGHTAEAQALEIAGQLCDALACLHMQQPPLTHGDVKPINVRRTRDQRMVLVDVGVWGAAGQDGGRLGQLRQQLSYRAPEQESGGPRAPASDIYGLGATLYFLMTGKDPPSASARMGARPEVLAPPHTLNPSIAPRISDAIMHAMALQPAERPASVAALREALLRTRSAPAARVTAPRRQERPAPKRTRQPGITARLSWSHHLDRLGVSALDMSTDGGLVAVAGRECVLLWKRERGALTRLWSRELRGMAAPSVAIHPRGQALLAGDLAGITLLSCTDPAAPPLWHAVEQHGAWNADGSALATAAYAALHIYAWDGYTIRRSRTIDMRRATGRHSFDLELAQLLWHPTDSDLLATITHDGVLRAWDARAGTLLAEHPIDPVPVFGAAMRATCIAGQIAWFAEGDSSGGQQIQLAAFPDLTQPGALPRWSHPLRRIEPLGATRLLGADTQGTILIWNLHDCALESIVHRAGGQPLRALAACRDGRWCAAGLADGRLVLWQLDNTVKS